MVGKVVKKEIYENPCIVHATDIFIVWFW